MIFKKARIKDIQEVSLVSRISRKEGQAQGNKEGRLELSISMKEGQDQGYLGRKVIIKDIKERRLGSMISRKKELDQGYLGRLGSTICRKEGQD